MNSTSFALRRGALLGLLVSASLVLAACGGGAAATPSDDNSAGGTVSVVDGAVAISADDLEFDANVIQATAGEAFTISFTNLEAVPHNVAVDTEEGGDEIVTGEVITGPDATTTINVPALDAGEYYFVCDLHPEMNGTIVVEG
jgi:plastocyanin